MENKNLLRKKILSLRKNLSEEEFHIHSNKVFQKIIHSHFFQQCDSIFTYIAFDQEIETKNLIHYSLKKEKKVGIPKIKNNSILPISFISWDDMHPGYSKILEPQSEIPFDFHQDTIIFVPGLVFDKKGNRMGFGKGFYDRFLKDLPHLKIGLAHSFQVVEQIIPDLHDIPINILITENQIYDFRNNFKTS